MTNLKERNIILHRLKECLGIQLKIKVTKIQEDQTFIALHIT